MSRWYRAGLVVLFAGAACCRPAKHTGAPPDTSGSETGPDDTGDPSVETAEETGDSGETGESAETGETAETSDTAETAEGPEVWASLALYGASATALTTRGRTACWGWEGAGLNDCPPGPFTAVSVGLLHACALRPDATVECWGADGKADHPFAKDYMLGQATPPAGEFVHVAAGTTQTCAIDPAGGLQCWGDPDPRLSAPTGVYTEVDVDHRWACALTPVGRVSCWGVENLKYPRLDPPRGTGWSHLTIGYNHGCVLDGSGTATCWGGIYADTDDAPEKTQFLSISAGDEATCGITEATEILCWETRANHGWVEAISPKGTGWASVAVGSASACAVSLAGEITCWGYLRGTNLDEIPPLPDDGADTG